MKQKRWVTTIYCNLTPKLKSCLLVSLSSSLKFERCANSLLTRKPKTKSSLIAMFTLYNVWQLLKMIKKLMQEKKLNDVLCMIFSLKIPFFLEPSKVQPALSFSFYFIFIFFFVSSGDELELFRKLLGENHPSVNHFKHLSW